MSKQQPILQKGNIKLRPLCGEDAHSMLDSLNDTEVARLTGTHQSFTFSAVESFCEQVAYDLDRFDYVICLLGQEQHALGEVVLNEIDTKNRTANFRGAIYSQANFGQGLGSVAISLLMDFAFDHLKLNRVELEVYEFNDRAKHVYEKLGFIEEGRKRQSLLWQGEYHDAIVMGLLAADWHQRSP